jgi:NitT/TauT family transport system permease protein
MTRRRLHRPWRQPFAYALAFGLVLLIIVLVYAEGFHLSRLRLPKLALPIDISELPSATFYSMMRMTVAYFLAVLFSLTVAYLAISNRWAERVIIPLLDFLQSVPVLGFFPAAVYLFIAMAPGHRIGIEMASIFLIFTAQAWNLAFGIYESWRTLPAESVEMANLYGLHGWLRFRTLLWPACLPKLIYNSIASWAGGWYFLIACEIIAIGPLSYRLPGLGSFLSHAAEEGRIGLLVSGLSVLLAIVMAMEFLLWRPLSIWATKFRYEMTVSTMHQESFMIHWWSRSPVTRRIRRLFRWLGRRTAQLMRRVSRRRLMRVVPPVLRSPVPALPWFWPSIRWLLLGAVCVLLVLGVIKGGGALVSLFRQPFPSEAGQLPAAIGASTLRLLAAYLIALAWTLPVAIWAGEREKVANVVIPLAEIGAAVPATALFPLIVIVVVRYVGQMNAASILLILTGMQWYLLFNLVAGVKNLPGDLKETAAALGLSRWLYWRSVVVPAIIPSLITGSITAWGGGWNALIVSEYFVYHGQTFSVLGIGSLLDAATYESGGGLMIVLSLTTMVLVVALINQLVWRRAYRVAVTRFRLDY